MSNVGLMTNVFWHLKHCSDTAGLAVIGWMAFVGSRQRLRVPYVAVIMFRKHTQKILLAKKGRYLQKQNAQQVCLGVTDVIVRAYVRASLRPRIRPPARPLTRPFIRLVTSNGRTSI